jgi:hypothetical protein
MHHQGCRARGTRERASVVDAAPDSGEKRYTAADHLGDSVDHCFGFRGGESIEFAGIAIYDENMDTSTDRSIDNRV